MNAAGDWALPGRARCRCGHFPTHHMVVIRLETSANWRLTPAGPCHLCGEVACRKYAPGGPPGPQP